MNLYVDGYTSEREALNLQRLNKLRDILILSDHHYTISWMYMNSSGNLMVAFKTGGSMIPIGVDITRAWQLIGGDTHNINLITDISMGVEIEKILMARKV